MDKETNFKKEIIGSDFEYADLLVRIYFENNWGCSYGIEELIELRERAKYRNKYKFLVEKFFRDEHFPLEWINFEGKEVMALKI